MRHPLFSRLRILVLELDLELGKAKVSVEMFGRTTPIDVSLNQIRKIN